MKLFCETGSEFITNNSPSNPRVGRCNLGCPATPVLSPTAALILPDKPTKTLRAKLYSLLRITKHFILVQKMITHLFTLFNVKFDCKKLKMRECRKLTVCCHINLPKAIAKGESR